MADATRVQAIVEAVGEVRPDLPILPTVFRPRPVGEVRGLRVAYVSTAPAAVLPKLAGHLEERYGCKVVASSGNLSDRRALARDLEATRNLAFDAYLTEIKAAAIDVVTRRGSEEGRPVLYCDNDPVPAGGGEALLDAVVATNLDQLLRQLLLTSPGERVCLPEFGCGLRRLVFAPQSDALVATVTIQVQQAIERWLADQVQLQGVDVLLGSAADPALGLPDGALLVTVSYLALDTLTGSTVQLAVV